jgi:hypothetical protein
MNRRKLPIHHALASAALLALAASPASAADFFWTTGNFVSGVTAPNPLPATDTLFGQAGGDKNFSGVTFTNLGTVAWQTNQRIGFLSSTVSNGGLWDLQADANLTYAGGNASSFSNTGTFRKSAGIGSAVIGGNIGFTNAGAIDAQSGTIDFAGGSATFNAGSQFTGAGVVRISNSASFAGAFSSANLRLDGGTFTGTGAQLASGSVDWTGGSIAGFWQVNAGQTLRGQVGGDKNLSGVTFTNLGTVSWQTANRIGFVSSAIVNTGLWDMQADANLTYAGGNASSFTNNGTFRKSAGSGSTVIGGNIGFVNTGAIDAQNGTIDFAGGSATFDAGTQFTGAGLVRISNNAGFVGGFSSANLRLDGGTFTGTGAQLASGSVDWTGGSVAGNWQVNAGQTLRGQVGVDKNLSGVTFTNLGTVSWQTANRIGFVSSAIVNTGLWDMQADANLTYAGGNASSFTNGGTFRKSAGSGSTVIGGNIGFVNTGAIDAQNGTIDFAGGSATFDAGTQFTGAGVVRISNNAAFVGTFDSANLRLDGGTFNGNNTTPAVLNGTVRWTGGAFAGTWQVASGQTLQVLAGTNKDFIGTTFTNTGTVSWQTTERAGFVSSAVVNTGLWDVQADANLTYAGGNASSFTNSGTFRKSAGGGSTAIGGNIGFVNTGAIDAQSGTIDFAGGNATFNAGTRFTGGGVVRVSNNAAFVGAFDSANLRLDAGAFTGNGAVLAAGNVVWNGGNFSGNWQVGAGQTLAALAGGDKNFVGVSFTNDGTVAWQTTNRIGFVSSTVVNAGLWDLQADANLTYAGGNASSFTNSGTFRKSGGSGTSTVGANVAFSNPGTVEVLSGTLQFTGAFVNPGTVRGTGTVAAAGVTNNGSVEPGVAAGAPPATFGIAGTFAQGAAGQLLIDVQSLASHDLLQVSGAVSLGGTLGVQCSGACFFAVGDEIVVLDYTGTRSGTQFAALTLAGFATGGFQAVYDDANTRVLLRVTEATAPIPEPGTWAMMVLGVLALGASARQRRC